ncbi:MAG: hypothetical protein U9Q40_01440, partial [Campylobacterota bacterium]|nr:hypothetical protein [Campylobacterota bacterium]
MKTTSIKVLTATLLLFSQVGCASDSYYYKNSQKVELQPKPFRSSTKIDYYQNSRGIVLGVSDRLILKLKNPQNLKEYLLEFDLKIERSLSENIYL